jgi:hypothetical protein
MKSALWLLTALALAGCDDYHSGQRQPNDGDGGGTDTGAAGSTAAPDSGGGGAFGGGGMTAMAGSSSGASFNASGGLPASVKCDAPAQTEPALVEQQLTPSDEDFLNPERGFHADRPLPQPSLNDYRAEGSSLLRSYVILADFRTQPLPQSFLDQLSYSFDVARDRGLKVVLRFAYNDDGTEDAPLDSVLEHISQLKPILQAQSDVIAVVQAGFMGRWGEWHHSEHGLNSGPNRKTIALALLDMVPASRMIQLRYPWQRKQIFPNLLDEATAFSGMGGARVGHHNDCFLTSNNDLGTYGDFVDEATGSAPDSQVIRWMDYVAQESRYTATGAETCQNTDRSSCTHALNELSRFHYSYLNSDYLEDVNQRWVDEGCMPEIRRRLGYRFSLEQLSFNDHVAPGGVLRLAFTLKNQGFAAPFNEHPVYVVLDGPARIFAKLSLDPRAFLPEKGPLSLGALLRVPGTLAPGKYRVALWLPDASKKLQSRAEYAIRLANGGVWNATAGDNTLGEVTVDASAGGCIDGSATELSELR